jgi:cell wall assembly regulator SMI1
MTVDVPTPAQHKRITELVMAIAAEWRAPEGGWWSAWIPWERDADEAQRCAALSRYLQATYGQAMWFDSVVAARALDWLECSAKHLRRPAFV